MFAAGTRGVLSAAAIDDNDLADVEDVGDLEFVARFSHGAEEPAEVEGEGADSLTAVTPITADEAELIRGAGLKLAAVSEVPLERLLSGEDAGTADGESDLETWKDAGLEEGDVIYVTFLGRESDIETASAYFSAYREAIGDYFALGLRAPTPLLQLAVGEVDHLWRAGNLGLNNDGAFEGPGLDNAQMRAMSANLLHTSPAQIIEFEHPSEPGFALVSVIRGESDAPTEDAPEADEAENDGSEDTGETATEYEHLTVPEIKEIIEHRNSQRDEADRIEHTGKKADLIAALEADDQKIADAESEKDAE